MKSLIIALVIVTSGLIATSYKLATAEDCPATQSTELLRITQQLEDVTNERNEMAVLLYAEQILKGAFEKDLEACIVTVNEASSSIERATDYIRNNCNR